MTPQHRLIITEADYERVLRHVGVTSDERMGFLYCGRTEAGDQIDWLARAVDLPDDSEYGRQGPGEVSLKADAVVARLLRARGVAGFVDMHSHPFTDHPWPSVVDERGSRNQLRVLRDLAPGTSLLRIIVGRQGALFGEVHDTSNKMWAPLAEVVVLGPDRRRAVRPVNVESDAVAVPDPLDARTAAVVGARMDALRHSRVLVIGAGGVGSAVLSQIAGLVRQIDIVDPDLIERHNLPRLYHAREADIGRAKADVEAEVLRARFSRLVVNSHVVRFPDQRSKVLLRASCFVFCCPDARWVRWAAASESARTMRPLVEVGCGGRRGEGGVITDLGYHVRLQVPGGPCLACNGLDLSRLEDPTSTETKTAAGYIEGDDTIQGELVTLTTRAATDAVDTFVAYMTGYAGPARSHIYFDALNYRSLDLSTGYTRNHACSLCGAGDHVIAGAGDDVSEQHRILVPTTEVSHATL